MKHHLFILGLAIILLGQSCGNMPRQDTAFTPQPHALPASADTNVILPPAWAFGIIYGAYTNQEETIDLVNKIIAHDYPIDAFWIDSWIWDWQNQGKGPAKYIDFVADTISYPDMEAMWTFMEQRRIKAGMWVWDCILKTGNEAAYEDFRSRGFFKNEYIRTDSWHNGSRTTIMGDNSEPVKGTWCGDFDFENPAAVAYFKQRMKPFFDMGVDFIKLDKTDALPVCKAIFEMTQELGKETKGRGFMFAHSSVLGEEYKRYPGKWTDDTRSDWSVETQTRSFSSWIPKVGLKENIAMYTDTRKKTYQIPFLANDLGGFSVSEDRYVDKELYVRWLQFAMFVPLTTPFAQPENPSRNIAFLVSEQADTLFRKYAQLKLTLFPYIYSYAHQSRWQGRNTIRLIPDQLYQYKFGEEILVAPIYEEGKRAREVFLPEGASWVNYWTGETHAGGQTLTVAAPIEHIPLFIRQGAIIPQRKYARSVELGTNEVLELHVYPGADGAFTLIEDDGTSNDYLKGMYAVTEIVQKQSPGKLELEVQAVKGYYQDMPARRTWEVLLHTGQTPKQVRMGKQRIAFSAENGVIRAVLPDHAVASGWKLEVLW